MTTERPTVAIVGSGISALTAAYVLRRDRRVTLFEADDRLGGHTHTHRLSDPDIALDTGFIVHNQARYPLLTKLFDELGVRTRRSEMSMSVSCDGCGLRYVSGSALRAVPNRPESVDDRVWRKALLEFTRFNRTIRGVLADPRPPELGELLATHDYSAYFVQHMVLPLVCAVWSCGPRTALRYPSGYLFQFLDNHGLLHGSAASRWRTVAGGSADYVRRIVGRLAEVRTATPVVEVRRVADGVEVTTAAGRAELFDAAVIGTHPADVLAMLADPTQQEQDVFASIGYVASEAILHTDASLLPEQLEDRASWNLRQDKCAAEDRDVSISYHLNRLQGLDTAREYVVTLNATDRIDPSQVIASMRYEHPVYTATSLAAIRRLPRLNSRTLAFAGAYHGWGFHEDGCRSGATAAHALGSTW